MLPEAAAARDHVLPEPRLALMHAGRDAVAERRAFERGADALLVHGVASLVQRREQRVAEIVLVDARGDADVASGKPGAERMMRQIEPAAPEVVAHALGDVQAEIELRCFGETLPQTGIVGGRLIADRAHHRDEFASQFVEQFADRRRRHTLVRVVDMRVGDVFVRREEGGIFAAQVECPFEIRHHGREVVRRPRPRPCIVGGGAVRVRARDIVRRYLDLLLIFAACDTDQARVVVVVRQALAKASERVDQRAERRRDRPLVRKAMRASRSWRPRAPAPPSGM